MPTYEYKCPECGASRDVKIPIKDHEGHIEFGDECNLCMWPVISGGTAVVFRGGRFFGNSKRRRDERDSAG